MRTDCAEQKTAVRSRVGNADGSICIEFDANCINAFAEELQYLFRAVCRSHLGIVESKIGVGGGTMHTDIEQELEAILDEDESSQIILVFED